MPSASSAPAASADQGLLLIIVPNHILRQRAVIVQVDVAFPYSDARDAAVQRGLHNLVAVRVGVAADVHGLAAGVCRVVAPAFGKVPLPAPVGAVQHQGDASLLPHFIQEREKFLVHLLDGAGRLAAEKFSRGKILTHRRLLFRVLAQDPETVARPGRGPQ